MALFLSIILVLVFGLAVSLWSSESPADDYDKDVEALGDQDPHGRWFF